MIYTVYILYSHLHNKHYTGYTSNLAERLRSHNEYGKDWTAKYRPWKLIFTKEFENKNEAMAYERWLKSGAGGDFIKSLEH
ncbi:MAG: GIY-YIG nuclease family protein [Agriterribacter sp.]